MNTTPSLQPYATCIPGMMPIISHAPTLVHEFTHGPRGSSCGFTVVSFHRLHERRHKEQMASEEETSGSNCLQPHFHAIKF